MVDMSAALESLRADIERAGYYPQLVTDGVWSMLAGEEVVDHLVHHEATFDSELRRHLSVLVLTPTRLIFGHTDDHPPHGPGAGAAPAATAGTAATTTAEAVALRQVRSVVLSRVVTDAPRYVDDSSVHEVVITIGWGTMSRLDLEPAACEDPDCEADHGYTGSLTADDFVLRVSEAAEGHELVRRAQEFAASVSASVARLAS